MIKRKYYFNGAYLIKGFKIFGNIRGKIISTQYPHLYEKGSKVNIKAETFKEIPKEKSDILKDWGFVND